jgi:hypothetical protein
MGPGQNENAPPQTAPGSDITSTNILVTVLIIVILAGLTIQVLYFRYRS